MSFDVVADADRCLFCHFKCFYLFAMRSRGGKVKPANLRRYVICGGSELLKSSNMKMKRPLTVAVGAVLLPFS